MDQLESAETEPAQSRKKNTANDLTPQMLDAIRHRSVYDLRHGFHPSHDGALYLAGRAELAAADRAQLLEEVDRLRTMLHKDLKQ